MKKPNLRSLAQSVGIDFESLSDQEREVFAERFFTFEDYRILYFAKDKLQLSDEQLKRLATDPNPTAFNIMYFDYYSRLGALFFGGNCSKNFNAEEYKAKLFLNYEYPNIEIEATRDSKKTAILFARDQLGLSPEHLSELLRLTGDELQVFIKNVTDEEPRTALLFAKELGLPSDEIRDLAIGKPMFDGNKGKGYYNQELKALYARTTVPEEKKGLLLAARLKFGRSDFVNPYGYVGSRDVFSGGRSIKNGTSLILTWAIHDQREYQKYLTAEFGDNGQTFNQFGFFLEVTKTKEAKDALLFFVEQLRPVRNAIETLSKYYSQDTAEPRVRQIIERTNTPEKRAALLFVNNELEVFAETLVMGPQDFFDLFCSRVDTEEKRAALLFAKNELGLGDNVADLIKNPDADFDGLLALYRENKGMLQAAAALQVEYGAFLSGLRAKFAESAGGSERADRRREPD